MSDKKKSLFRKLIGFDDLKSTYTITKNIIKDKESDDENRVETFEDALKRYNITEENKEEYLNTKYNQLKNASFVYYAFSSIILLIALYNTFTQTFSLFIVLNFLLVLFFFLNGFKFAFRCFQIKHEKLGMLKEFTKDFKSWIPIKK